VYTVGYVVETLEVYISFEIVVGLRSLLELMWVYSWSVLNIPSGTDFISILYFLVSWVLQLVTAEGRLKVEIFIQRIWSLD